MKLFALLLLLVGCSSSTQEPAPVQDWRPSLHATIDDSPNCTTELEQSSTLCDSDHLLVLMCGVPEACPDYRRCVGGAGMPDGLVWCCTP
jgi:hypothetical protein